MLSQQVERCNQILKKLSLNPDIEDGFIDNESEMKFNGLPTKLIDVYRVGNQNALDISSTVKNYIENAYNTWENPPEIVG